MNRQQRRALARAARRRNDHGSDRFVEIPPEDWPKELFDHLPIQVLRSRRFLVQIFEEGGEVLRLSVCRTTINNDGNYRAGISWDELYRIKAELGYGAKYAIEIYPRELDLVDVANMRHIWILPRPLDIGWFAAGR